MKLTASLLKTTDAYIKKLAEGGIQTTEDFITHYPRGYEDKSEKLKLFHYINIKEKNTVICKLHSLKQEKTQNNKLLIRGILEDEQKNLCEAVWFNRRFLISQYKSGDRVEIYGKPKYAYGKLSFPSPDIGKYNPNKDNDFSPVYPDCNYIPGAWFAKKMPLLRAYMQASKDILPQKIISEKKLASHASNLIHAHFPESPEAFKKARKELAYEEVFLMQYSGLKKKWQKEKSTTGQALYVSLNPDRIKHFLSHIPFELTNEQKITIFQILKDMEKSHTMNRLLEGDVGTGKTLVALLTAVYIIQETDCQVACMAPTEILATQHQVSMQKFLDKQNISWALLTGNTKGSEKKGILKKLASGETKLIIGTHALIQKDVCFKKLGYVIIDEQHRFGVEQRQILEEYRSEISNIPETIKQTVQPHLLHMTATPIPRTLALTLFGEQDISIIQEYPKGRKQIHTVVVRESGRKQVLRFIEEQVHMGRQIYWISPLVEESEKEGFENLASAQSVGETLALEFPDFRIGVLHGKLKSGEKDEIMKQFLGNKIHILSSTSVVEVGVNNPNATIICIEGAERFGLSQLHQFRGRVGRGEHQSYCYLFPTHGGTSDRLKAMEKTNNGFELSQIDLELRGPGEVYGVRQSGTLDFKLANISDLEMIGEIRSDIERLFG